MKINEILSAKKSFFTLLLSLSISYISVAQEKLSFQIKSALQNNSRSNELVHILVKGDQAKIKAFVNSNGGHLKYSYGDISSVSIPSNLVESLLRFEAVKSYGMSNGRPVLLNDTMLINNRIDSVHAGLGNLPQGYTGKGVVMGIIDTGIDFTHPDFKDSTGKTRIKFIWDHTKPFSASLTPQPYNYGQEWNSAAIDAGISTHDDQPAYFGHGSNVAGTAAGNGLAVNNFKGAAPESDIIAVSVNFNSASWMTMIVDAVDYIFAKADSMGQPAVVNLSLGDYLGSHDGKDLAARMIDSMVTAKRGRVVVSAAGNAGHIAFHLGYDVTADTNFTWFKYNPSSFLGYGAVYFQLWADTNNFNNVKFAVGADKVTSGYSFRGRTPFDSISNRLNMLVTDTLVSVDGNRLAIVDTWAEIIDGNYFMEIHIKQPDSNQYNFRFITHGTGRFDVWSAGFLGTSEMVSTGLPDTITFPDIKNYKSPDKNQTIVSSWNCSPNVISVGNYINRYSYVDYNGNTQIPDPAAVPGNIAASSSKGPSRTGIIKPDVSASGAVTLTTARLATAAAFISGADVFKVAQGGKHYRNGGTSIAAPVVAGIAALYLEKCPNADYAEIKNALLSTARSDNFTGSIPNNTYGYGKANALAALENSNFKVDLTGVGNNPFCLGDSLMLATADSFSSYLWSDNSVNRDILIKSSGSFSVSVTNESGCSSTSKDTAVTVNPLPAVPVISATDTAFCAGDSAILSSSVNAGNTWSDNSTSQTITAKQPGDYFVTVTDSNGCSSTSLPQTIIVYEPVAIITASDTAFCTGDSATLTSSAISGNMWSDTSITQSIIVKQSGSYFVTVTDSNGCSATSLPVTITENPLPPVPVITASDTAFCPGAGVVLFSSAFFGNNKWSDNSTLPLLFVTQPGSYFVTVTNGKGCSSTSLPVDISVYSLPSDPEITSNLDTLFSTTALAYQWYINDTLIAGADSNFIKVLKNGSYTVVIADANGCTASSAPFNFNSIGIKEGFIDELKLYPNPANGMFNLEFVSTQKSGISILIYDVTGKEIIKTELKEASGQYHYKGNLTSLPSGVYFLKIKSDDGVIVKKIIRY